VRSAHGGNETLADGNTSLAGASNAALDHDPVLVDLAVVGKSTNRGNALLGEISFGRSAGLVVLAANTQHSLVDLGTMMVTLLTSASDGESNAGRMPSTDTGDLAETSVGLAGEAGDTPTRHDTGISVTAGGGADIQALSFSEHLGNVNLLLEKSTGKVNLGGNVGTTVDLDLEEVGNLLSELQLANLGVGQNADDLAVLLNAVDLGLNILGLLSSLLGVLGESLPLGSVPVLVETTTNIIGQMVGPHGGQSAKTIGGLDVANNADNNHGGSLEDSHGFHSFLLVQLGSRALNFAHDVSHAGLVAHEGS